MTSSDDLARGLEALDFDSLLPPRRSKRAVVGDVVLRDSLTLGGGSVLAVFTGPDGLVVAPLVVGEGKPVRRAVPGDGVFERLLDRLASGGSTGRFSFEPTGQTPVVAGERAIDVDQSNESVVVGDRAVVKLYPRTGGIVGSGADLPARLVLAGFTSIPAPFGVVSWTDVDDRRWVVATASAYLPGARDGWEWYLATLLEWLDRGDVSDPAAFAPAVQLGRMTAEMHVALASASELVPAPTGVADRSVADGWRSAANAVADDALTLTGGGEGSRLATREPEIRAELDRLGEAAGSVIMRVHGDFHVGQVLEWRGGYAFTDFDGNPMAPPADHDHLDTPVRDVAAFVRSIDHLGRVASHRRPGRDDALDAWIASSRASYLDAYVEGLEERDERRLFDERLLRPLEIAQECHEFVYAARFLPRWLYVPDLAMRSLIPMED